MRFLSFFLLPILAFAGNDETLFLRRIADFWHEGEYAIAKSQMEEFLKTYPESDSADLIRISLGDVLLKEGNFSQSLALYAALASEEFKAMAHLNRLQSLYGLEWYATLADECEAFLQEAEESDAKTKTTFYLAIALYHQCLNAAKDAGALLQLAQRAEPYFETLLQKERSTDITMAFAHLCCILQDYEKAADLYLSLEDEEMQFQAAIMQAKFDKTLAMQTLELIAKNGGKKAKDAAYHQFILRFETGQYGDLCALREEILKEMPEDKKALAHLYLGKSLLAEKQYSDAISELRNFLKEPTSKEALRIGLVTMIEAAHFANDLQALGEAITSLDREDPELPKARLLRVQLLKKQSQFEEARKEIDALVGPEVGFEEIDLDFQEERFDACRLKSLKFMKDYPTHELLPCVRRYLATSSYQMKNFDEVIDVLAGIDEPNAYLLLALSYRDGKKDLDFFCKNAEIALEKKADWVGEAEIHIALFNAYLDLSHLEKGADHLFSAFSMKMDISRDNLLWLGDWYFSKEEKERATQIFSFLIDAQFDETACYKLALLTNEPLFLEKLLDAYTSDPDGVWEWEHETRYLMAKSCIARGEREKALQELNALAVGPILEKCQASARLERVKLLKGEADVTFLAAELKNLVLQKRVEFEPIHLEAAMEYINLLAPNKDEKRLTLLEKMKSDFESGDDVISKEYAAALLMDPEKKLCFDSYMLDFDAEICLIKEALIERLP